MKKRGNSRFADVFYATIIVFVAVFLFTNNAFAATSDTISFQARVLTKDRLTAPSGNYAFRFNIYTSASGGSSIWSETWSGSNKIAVRHGLFTVQLGKLSPLTNIPFTSPDLYMTVAFDSNSNGTYDQVFGSRIPLTAVPFAISTNKLGGKTEAQFADLNENETVAGAYSFTNDITLGQAGLTVYLNSQVAGSIVATRSNTYNLGSADIPFAQVFGNTINTLGRGSLRLYNSANTHYSALQASNSITADTTWTLPATDGTNGQVLKTDGNGNLAWANNSGGTGGTGSSTLAELTDVSLGTLANNNILQYSSASSKWVNRTITDAGIQATLVFGNLAGTTNQITVTGGTNAIVGSGVSLALPQDIATGSAVQFGTLGLGGAAGSSRLTFAASTAATGGIDFGGDTNLYRSAADTLKTDDSLSIAGTALNLLATKPARFYDTDSSNYLALAAPGTVAGNVTWTLPSTDGGNGQVLTTNSTGGLYWSDGGGTGAPSDAQYLTLATNAGLSGERVLTGTANQVILTDTGANGALTLSLPQSIATSSSPTFAGLTNSALTAGRVTYAGTSGVLTDSANMAFDTTNGLKLAAGSTSALQLTSTAGTAVGGILFGADTTLYRSGADTLKTDDSLSVGSSLTVATALNLAGTSNQIVFQSAGTTGTLTWTPATSNKTITLPNATGTVAVSASAPLALSATGGLSIPAADSTHDGYLTSSDWSNFNGKAGTITTGNLTESTSSVLTITGGTGAVVGTGTTILVKQAGSGQAGYLSSADWSTFNGKQAAGNYITALTGDVTASGPGSASATIANKAVTLAKMDDMATASLLGRNSSGTGAPEVLSAATTKTLLSLNNVENTALSTWAGTSNITTVGTIGTGTWNATAIADGKIASALTGKTYNALTLTAAATGFTIAGGTTSKTLTVGADASVSGTNTGDQTITLTGDVTGSGTSSFAATIASKAVTLAKMDDMATASILGRNSSGTGAPEVLSAATTKTLLSLNNVENTALSTWAGTSNITTVGTIGTGTWNATAIADGKIASALTGKTYNALSLTAAATGFTIAGGTTSKTLTVNNTLTLSGTDTSTLNIGSGGTLGTAAFTAATAYQAAGTYVTSVSGTSPIASSGGTTPAISLNDAGVTYAKIQNVAATSRILGRVSAGSGVIEELTAANVKTILSLAQADISGLTTASSPTFSTLNLSGASNQLVLQSGGVTGTLTWTPATTNKTITLPNITGTVVTTGDTGSVTNAMLAGSIAASKLVGTDIATVGTVTAGTWSATTIAVNKGGTGQTSYTDGQLLIGNTSGNTLTKATLTGTTNRVTVTNGNGTITLSGPQDIATSSAVQFGSLGLGTAAGTSKLTFTAATTAAGGIDFGGDANFYRGAANELATDDLLSFTSTKTNTTVDFKSYKSDSAGGTSFIFDTSATVSSNSLFAIRNNTGNKFTVNAAGGVAIAGATLETNYVLELPNSASQKAKANAWDTYSDRTLKNNIVDLPYGLSTILAMQPRSFDYIADGSHSIGFIAQEMKPLVPEIVTGEDGHMAITYDKVTAVLVKALQEEDAKVEAINTKLTGILAGNLTANEITSKDGKDLTLTPASGLVKVAGDLTVNGKLVASSLHLANDSAGRASIAAGETSVFVPTSKISADDQVLLTPITPETSTPENVQLYRGDINPTNGFYVKLVPATALPYEQKFDWLIVRH